MLAGHDFEFVSYDVVDDGEFPADVHDADGWLITGSRHGAYEDLPWIAPLEEFIREAYAAHVPMVGICFGHQIIAQALGGKVAKFDNGWSVGPQRIRLRRNGNLALNAWHQDQVIDLPKGAKVIGATAISAKYAALVYGDRAYTVQPHPEFSGALIGDLDRMPRRGQPGMPDDIMTAGG